jgi:hypothetical protein
MKDAETQSKGLRCIRYLEPVRTEGAVRQIISAAARILMYERFIDGLEDEKRINGQLPAQVERELRVSMGQASSDVDELVRGYHRLISEAEAVGAVDELVVAACECVRKHGKIPIKATSAQSLMPAAFDGLVKYGMPSDIWRWTLSHLETTDGALRCSDDGLQYETEKQRISIVPTPVGPRIGSARASGRAARPREAGTVANDPDRSLGLASSRDGVQLTPLIAFILRQMTEAQRNREQETIRLGLQITKLGILPLVIIAVVVVVIAVAIFIEDFRLGAAAVLLGLLLLLGGRVCKTDETGTRQCVDVPPASAADDSPTG